MGLMQSQPMLHNKFGPLAAAATKGNRKTLRLHCYSFPCGRLTQQTYADLFCRNGYKGCYGNFLEDL